MSGSKTASPPPLDILFAKYHTYKLSTGEELSSFYEVAAQSSPFSSYRLDKLPRKYKLADINGVGLPSYKTTTTRQDLDDWNQKVDNSLYQSGRIAMGGYHHTTGLNPDTAAWDAGAMYINVDRYDPYYSRLPRHLVEEHERWAIEVSRWKNAPFDIPQVDCETEPMLKYIPLKAWLAILIHGVTFNDPVGINKRCDNLRDLVYECLNGQFAALPGMKRSEFNNWLYNRPGSETNLLNPRSANNFGSISLLLARDIPQDARFVMARRPMIYVDDSYLSLICGVPDKTSRGGEKNLEFSIEELWSALNSFFKFNLYRMVSSTTLSMSVEFVRPGYMLVDFGEYFSANHAAMTSTGLPQWSPHNGELVLAARLGPFIKAPPFKGVVALREKQTKPASGDDVFCFLDARGSLISSQAAVNAPAQHGMWSERIRLSIREGYVAQDCPELLALNKLARKPPGYLKVLFTRCKAADKFMAKAEEASQNLQRAVERVPRVLEIETQRILDPGRDGLDLVRRYIEETDSVAPQYFLRYDDANVPDLKQSWSDRVEPLFATNYRSSDQMCFQLDPLELETTRRFLDEKEPEIQKKSLEVLTIRNPMTGKALYKALVAQAESHLYSLDRARDAKGFLPELTTMVVLFPRVISTVVHYRGSQ